MALLPSRKKTDRALVEAARAAGATVKEANRCAGQLVAKGNYQGAEQLVAVAKAAGAFQGEIAALHQRWRELAYGNSKQDEGKAERTPLWQYYKPILAALAALNGNATRRDLEKHLETSIPNVLRPGDLELNARGKPLWKLMVRRARKPMIKEKFIEDGSGKNWVITPAGRRAMEAPPPQAG